MKFLSLKKEKAPLKALVYGNTGTGKSSLAGTCENPLVLMSEVQGQLSLLESAERAQNELSIPPIGISSVNDLRVIFSALEAAGESFRIGDHEFKKPSTIVIDSITDVSKMAMAEILAKGKRDIPQQADWLLVTNVVTEIVRKFRNLPFDVLFLALVDEFEEGASDSEKVTHFRPSMSPKALSNVICAAVNIVGVSKRETVKTDSGVEKKYSIIFETPDRIFTKKAGKLERVENPDFKTIKEKALL